MDTVAALLIANPTSQPAVPGGQAIGSGPSTQFDAELLALLASHVPSSLGNGLAPVDGVPTAPPAGLLANHAMGRSLTASDSSPPPAVVPAASLASMPTAGLVASDVPASPQLRMPSRPSSVTPPPVPADSVPGLPEGEARDLVARLVAQAQGTPVTRTVAAPAASAVTTPAPTAEPELAATFIVREPGMGVQGLSLQAPLRAAAVQAQGLTAGADVTAAGLPPQPSPEVLPAATAVAAPSEPAEAGDPAVATDLRPRVVPEPQARVAPEAMVVVAQMGETLGQPVAEASEVPPSEIAVAGDTAIAASVPAAPPPAAERPRSQVNEPNTAQPSPAAPDQPFAEEHPQPWGSRAGEAMDGSDASQRDAAGTHRLAARPEPKALPAQGEAVAAREPGASSVAAHEPFRVELAADDTSVAATRTVEVASRDLDREMPGLLAQQARVAQQGREQELRVRIRPPELGEIRVVFRVRNGELTGSVTAEREDVRGWLAAEAPSWREELAAGGLKVARIDVGLTPQGDTQGQPQPSHGEAPRSGSQATPGPAIGVPDEMSDAPQPVLGVNAARHSGRIDYLA